ncbi:DUF2306 domain-containing protein [Marinicella rhabdoformis]|uniref:DUF2306 domain-containing protein n=1 Tax=Marinicella rhabdoformis TaxID=2580566 RepID=UPI0012AEC376|nr:DUF2306 domain-containing protein [Marinicella rhabdoformis]
MPIYIKYFIFCLYAIAAVGVAYYAVTYFQQPINININNPFQLKLLNSGWLTPMHFYASGLALALTPWQLSKKIRNFSKSIHRTIGLLYVLSVLLGGVSGLLLALNATGGWVAKLGFGSLAVIWLSTTAMAFYHALQHDISKHKIWIYRSIALTTAGITLRIMLGVGLGLFQWPFLTVYVPIAWLCWVPNLIFCEWFIQRRFIRRPQTVLI